MTFTLSDGDAQDTATAVLTVLNANAPPEITGQALDLSMPEDSSLGITTDAVSVSDADDPEEPFLLIVLAGEGYSLSGNTVIPAPDFSGTLSVPVQVSDGQDSSNVYVLAVEVISVNDPPSVTNISPTGPVEMNEGEAMAFGIAASDVDYGDALIFTWVWDGDTVLVGQKDVYILQTGYSNAGSSVLLGIVSDSHTELVTTWQVDIKNVAMPPVLRWPSGAVQADDNTPLIWNHTLDPDLGESFLYHLEISRDSLFGELLQVRDSLTDSLILLASLEALEEVNADEQLFWRVEAYNTYGYTTGFPPEPASFIYMGRGSAVRIAQPVPERLFIDRVLHDPFSEYTLLRFGIPGGGAVEVRFEFYDASGRRVWVTSDRYQPGIHTAVLGKGLPAGMYRLRLSTGRGFIRETGLIKLR